MEFKHFEVLNLHRCPFCKSLNYAVEYRGVKSKEERSLEEMVRHLFLDHFVNLLRFTF